MLTVRVGYGITEEKVSGAKTGRYPSKQRPGERWSLCWDFKQSWSLEARLSLMQK